MIERKHYYDLIEPFLDQPLIKVITGIRRSGKSTMMKMLQNKLIERGVPKEQIIYVNFESMQFLDIRISVKFYEYVMDKVIAGQRMYLFFDEIQIVDHWEEAVNSFLVDLDADIYITGSNSNLLSSEISTLLTGRYIQFRLYPLTFKEMIDFHNELGKTEKHPELLWQFIRRGGFPMIHISDYDESTCYRIINDIYDSIVLRDVVQRYGIRNIELLSRIVKYIIDNVGNTFSAKSISDYFKSQNRKVDLNTIYNYIDALESSFVINKVNRYDVHGKEILKTQEKYYLADQGIQHAIFGYKDRNISGVLENIVYNELIMRGYQVYVGKIQDLEIDFVAERKNEKVYVQVTYQMNNESTINREFKPLLMVKDHYPKYVVSMDENFKDNIEGVRHLYLGDFITSDRI
ncbi:MAG: ATP-binding protein [Bacillota bacterium]|nr:ATP-binding protein [Bacillota bacterium]